MRVTCWCLGPALMLLACAPGGAQDLPPTPKGPRPHFGIASAVEKDGKVTIELFELRDVVGIQVMDHIEFIQMDNWLLLKSSVLGEDIRAYRLDGKPADAKEVLKAVAKPHAVAYFVGYDKTKPVQPDPFYLNLLKEGSIVLGVVVPPEPPAP